MKDIKILKEFVKTAEDEREFEELKQNYIDFVEEINQTFFGYIPDEIFNDYLEKVLRLDKGFYKLSGYDISKDSLGDPYISITYETRDGSYAKRMFMYDRVMAGHWYSNMNETCYTLDELTDSHVKLIQYYAKDKTIGTETYLEHLKKQLPSFKDDKEHSSYAKLISQIEKDDSHIQTM